jgi:hypothetical protein
MMTAIVLFLILFIDEAHESHEVKGLALNFSQRALRCVHAHSIGERMGNQEALHAAAARCEALRAELGQDTWCPQHDHERVDRDPLLVELKDIAQQGILNCLQLADRINATFFLDLRIMSRELISPISWPPRF